MTKLRCWPGCLAMIIKDAEHPENVGAQVTVLHRHEGEYFGVGPEWWIKPSRLLVNELFDWNGQRTGEISESNEDVFIPDCELMPITPPPGSVEQDESLWLPTPNTEWFSTPTKEVAPTKQEQEA